jgi:hypothetical protein
MYRAAASQVHVGETEARRTRQHGHVGTHTRSCPPPDTLARPAATPCFPLGAMPRVPLGHVPAWPCCRPSVIIAASPTKPINRRQPMPEPQLPNGYHASPGPSPSRVGKGMGGQAGSGAATRPSVLRQSIASLRQWGRVGTVRSVKCVNRRCEEMTTPSGIRRQRIFKCRHRILDVVRIQRRLDAQ